MISEKEIFKVIKKIFKQEPIGYSLYEDINYIVPQFKLPDDPHDVPSMGGAMGIDSNTGEERFESLLDLCYYDGKIKEVKF